MKHLSFGTGWCAAALLSCYTVYGTPWILGTCLGICVASDLIDYLKDQS